MMMMMMMGLHHVIMHLHLGRPVCHGWGVAWWQWRRFASGFNQIFVIIWLYWTVPILRILHISIKPWHLAALLHRQIWGLVHPVQPGRGPGRRVGVLGDLALDHVVPERPAEPERQHHHQEVVEELRRGGHARGLVQPPVQRGPAHPHRHCASCRAHRLHAPLHGHAHLRGHIAHNKHHQFHGPEDHTERQTQQHEQNTEIPIPLVIPPELLQIVPGVLRVQSHHSPEIIHLQANPHQH
mmetsp:Transcript_107224/g.181172  ORF Transcript_107224/g.181172 Transcript_107224/m.181172 type:complete len:239 (+) Transcript_107224:64-780(+)